MSVQGNGQPVRFNVEMSVQTRDSLRQLHSQAQLAGTSKQFLAALRSIVDHLQKDPVGFGEPLYRLPAMKLIVRQGAVAPLVVDYAVHEELPLVFIRGFRLLG